jgi:hypothetical protein
MKNIFISDGYLFNTESKKLEKFEVIKVQTTLAEDSLAVYECKLGGVKTTITATPQDNITIYATEEDYRKGNVKEACAISATDVTKKYTRDGGYWAFVDGTAKEVNTNDIQVTYEKGKGFYSTEGLTFYTSNEEVYKYNNYIVKEADGTERVVECIANKVAPNNEQKELLKEFTDLLGKISASGLRLLYSTGDCQFFAYNTQNVEDCGVAYSGEKGWEGYEDVSEYGLAIDSSISYLYSEDALFVKFKK